MSTYLVQDVATLVFEPKMNDTTGQLDLELQIVTGNYTLATTETVQDYILAALGPVMLRVLDNASNTMDVYANGSGTAWPHANGVSQMTVAIPTTEDDTETVEMLIVAKGVTGEEVGRRSQTVIIKHRPSGT